MLPNCHHGPSAARDSVDDGGTVPSLLECGFD